MRHDRIDTVILDRNPVPPFAIGLADRRERLRATWSPPRRSPARSRADIGDKSSDDGALCDAWRQREMVRPKIRPPSD